MVAEDCAESLSEIAALSGYDLFIIDVNLPGENGFHLADRIRKSHPDVGIIIMTARNESKDKCAGYAVGADMYLTKPLEIDELEAAIRSLGRRLCCSQSASNALLFNKAQMTLQDPQGRSVSLTATEVTLLSAFVLAPDCRLEKWQIIDILKKDAALDPVRTMVVLIVRLRKKMKSLSVDGPTINMIRNWGYQLCAPVRVL